MNEQQFIQQAFNAGLNPQQVSQALTMFRAQTPKQTAPKAPAQKTIGGFFNNALGSAGKLVGDTATGIANIFNPDLEKNTVANLGRLGAGAVQKLDRSNVLGTGYEKYANAVGDQIYDRYGTIENVGNTLYTDPFGAAADVAGVVGGGAGLLARGAKAGQMAGLASKAGRVANIANSLDPLAIAGSVAGKAARGAGGLVKRIGSGVQGLGDNMAFSGMGNPDIQKNIVGISGKTPLQLSNEYNLWSRTPEAAQSAIDMIDETRLAKSAGKSVQTGNIIKAIDSKLKSLEGSIDDNAQIQRNYLMNKREQIMSGVMNPDQSVPLNIGSDKAIDFKQQIGRDRPKSAWNLGAAESAKSEAVGSLYDILKDEINTLDPDLKQLGKDESALIRFKELAENNSSRSGARQSFGLKDLAATGAGYAAGGVLPAAGLYIGNKILESAPAVKAGSKGFSAVGKAMQRPITVPKRLSAPLGLAKKAFTKTRKAARASESYKPKTEEKPKTIKQNVAGKVNYNDYATAPAPKKRDFKAEIGARMGGKREDQLVNLFNRRAR